MFLKFSIKKGLTSETQVYILIKIFLKPKEIFTRKEKKESERREND